MGLAKLSFIPNMYWTLPLEGRGTVKNLEMVFYFIYPQDFLTVLKSLNPSLQVKTTAHFGIMVCVQERPLEGDTQDNKTSALLRTIICTAIWSTISFMRDYLMIPCYLHGTQGFTAQRLSSTPEEQDLCADMCSTASTGGERSSQDIKNP